MAYTFDDLDDAPPLDARAPVAPGAAPVAERATPVARTGGGYSFDDLDDTPAPKVVQPDVSKTPVAATPSGGTGLGASFNRGLWSGIASTPEDLAGAADIIDDLSDDPDDPNSKSKAFSGWLRDQAQGIKGEPLQSKGALDIRSWDDLKTYVGETLGQAAGSTALPAAGAAVGAGVGFVSPVPGGAAMGALIGQGGPNLLIGMGTMRNALYDDPEIRKKIDSGELTRKQLAPYALIGGAIIGGSESFGLKKILDITGIGKEAVQDAVKLSIRKAILEGAKSEGLTETFQQITQEIGTYLGGGKPDVEARVKNVINAGIGGAVGGGGLGGAAATPGAVKDAVTAKPSEGTATTSPAQDPASVDQPTPPAAGTSTPGGTGAPPPAPSAGQGTATSDTIRVNPTGIDPDVAVAATNTPTAVDGEPTMPASAATITSPIVPASAVADVSRETVEEDPDLDRALTQNLKIREIEANVATIAESGDDTRAALKATLPETVGTGRAMQPSPEPSLPPGPVEPPLSAPRAAEAVAPPVSAVAEPGVGAAPAPLPTLEAAPAAPMVEEAPIAPAPVVAPVVQDVGLNEEGPPAAETGVVPQEPRTGPRAEAMVPVVGPAEGIAIPLAGVQGGVQGYTFDDLSDDAGDVEQALQPPAGTAPASPPVPSAQGQETAGAPARAPLSRRAADASKQLREIIHAAADKDEHSTPEIDAVADEILDGLHDRLASSSEGVGQIIRDHQEEVTKAAKRLLPARKEERQKQEAQEKDTKHREAEGQSKQKAAKARAEGKPQERARTKKTGDKAVEDIEQEGPGNEKPFERRARKAIEEQGDEAPAYYKKGVRAIDARKKTGKGKASGDKAVIREAAKTMLAQARAEEISARKQAQAEAGLKDQNAEKNDAIKTMVMPPLKEMGSPEYYSQIKAAIRKLVQDNPLPKKTDKNGEETSAPVDRLNRTYPPWLNFMIAANNAAKGPDRQGQRETLDDLVSTKISFDAGRHLDAMEEIFAASGDSFSQGGQDSGQFDKNAFDNYDGWAEPSDGATDYGFEANEEEGLGSVLAGPSFDDIFGKGRGKTIDVNGAPVTVQPENVSTVTATLKKYADPDAGKNTALGKVANVWRRFLNRRLSKLVGSVPVYSVSDDTIRQALPEHLSHTDPFALYIGPSLEDRARGKGGHILLNNRMTLIAEIEGTNAAIAHVITHEATHAATQLAIDHNFNGARDIFTKIYNSARNQHVGSKAYGFTLPGTRNGLHEFVTEALSNPRFQALLAETPVSDSLARDVRALAIGNKKPTWWDVMVGAVANALGLMGIGRQGMSALEAVMRVAPRAMYSEVGQSLTAKREMKSRLNRNLESRGALDPLPIMASVEGVGEAIRKRTDLPGRARGVAQFRNRFLETTQGMARRSRDLFGGMHNAYERAANAFLKIEAARQKNQEAGDEVIQKAALYMNRHDKAGGQMAKLMQEASILGVDPRKDEAVNVANKNFSKDGLLDRHKRRHFRNIRAEWLALPQEARDRADEMADFFGTASRTDTEQRLRNGLEDAKVTLPPGVTMDDAVKWFMSGAVNNETGSSTRPRSQLDEDMHKAFGKLADRFAQVGQYINPKGMYTPLIRDGNYVVSAQMPVAKPAGAITVEPQMLPNRKSLANRFVFTAENDLKNYLDTTDDQIESVQSIYVDPRDNSRTTKDQVWTDPKDPTKQILPKQLYVVTVQNKQVEFHDSLSEARKREKEWRKAGYTVNQAQEREKANSSIQELMPAQVNTLVKSLEQQHADNPQLREFLTQEVRRGAIRMMQGTRFQQRRLPRRNVKGYTKDLIKSALVYNQSHAQSMAQLTVGREMHKAMAEARAYAADPALRSQANTMAQGREELLKELEHRIASSASNGPLAGEGLVRMATTMSFIKSLVSPSFWMINATQPAFVTMPYLNGKYGVGAAAGHGARALRILGGEGVKNIGRGGWDMVKQAGKSLTRRGPDAPYDHMADMIAQVGKDKDGALWEAGLKAAAELGVFDQANGIDAYLSEYDSSMVDRFMGRVARVGGAMPAAIEANSRAFTLIATMSAEKAANPGASNEQIIQAGLDAIEETQGNYSRANSPTAFNTRLGRVAFQFKKYGVMMGNLLAKNFARMLGPSSTPKQRLAGFTTLASIVGVHFLMSGMVGLPFLEVARSMLLLAGTAMDVPDWEEMEKGLQATLSGILGARNAEYIMRGPLSRWLGVDLSNRMALDSFATFGSPKSDKEADVKAWLLDNIGGPTFSMVKDIIKGINSGDLSKMPLPKIITDAMKAHALSQGKTTAGKATTPTTTAETVGQVLGFRPASQARIWESGSGAKNVTKKAAQDDRTKLMDRWQALPNKGNERAKFFKENITPFNKGKPTKERIDYSDLYKRERTKQKKERADLKVDAKNG